MNAEPNARYARGETKACRYREGEGTAPATTVFAQKVAEGNPFYELIELEGGKLAVRSGLD